MTPYKLLKFVITVILFESGCSQNQERQCTTRQCAQTRGYIEYSSANPLSKTAWTITHPQGQFTTFVLHIKDVQVQKGIFAWLIIRENRYTFVKQHNIRGTDEQVLVFSDTIAVSISVPRIRNTKFRLNFYVGCTIEEGSDIFINKKRYQPQPTFNPYSAFYQPPPPYPQSCWFIIPTIQEVQEIQTPRFQNYPYYNYFYRVPFVQRRFIEVQQTYMTMQSVNLISASAISVTNIISGEMIMEANENEDFLVASLDKGNKTAIYTRNDPTHRKDTIILIDLQCSRRNYCGEATFEYKAYAFLQGDLDCIEEERKCLFNIGNTDYNCTAKVPIPELALLDSTSRELQTTSCPAFNIISESIINTFPEYEDFDKLEEPDIDALPQTDVSARVHLSVSSPALGDVTYKSPKPKQSKWKKKLQKCNNYSAYCSSKRCNRKRFRRKGCSKICYLIKQVLGLCSFLQYF